MTFWFSAQWREILLFLKQYENKKCFYKSRYILDKYEKAPFKIFLTHCTPPLICDDWPKIITPCTSSTRLDFFFVFQFDSTIKKTRLTVVAWYELALNHFAPSWFSQKNCSHLWHLWMSDSACRHQQLLWYCISFVYEFFASFSSTSFYFTYRSDRWLHEELWQLNEGN